MVRGGVVWLVTKLCWMRVFSEAQFPNTKVSVGIRDGAGEQPRERNKKKSDARDPMKSGCRTYGGGGRRVTE